MGVVQAHRFGNEYYATRRIFFWYQSWRWPRVDRARSTMDATPADPAGGGDRASAASSTSTAAAEVSATHRFTRRSAIFCPVSQLHPSIMSLGSVGTYGRRGGRDPDVPPIAPRLASMHNRPRPYRGPISPSTLEANCPHVAKFWRLGLCSVCSFVPVLRVLASPSATPKCVSGK